MQSMGLFFFFEVLIPFFDYTLFIEFDKMQVPYRDSCNIPNLYIACLATTGICVFVRRLRLAHFLYADRGVYEQEYSKNSNRYYRRATVCLATESKALSVVATNASTICFVFPNLIPKIKKGILLRIKFILNNV